MLETKVEKLSAECVGLPSPNSPFTLKVQAPPLYPDPSQNLMDPFLAHFYDRVLKNLETLRMRSIYENKLKI